MYRNRQPHAPCIRSDNTWTFYPTLSTFGRAPGDDGWRYGPRVNQHPPVSSESVDTPAALGPEYYFIGRPNDSAPPSDDAIAAAVHRFLEAVSFEELNNITRRDLQQDLETEFQQDLGSRRRFINQTSNSWIDQHRPATPTGQLEVGDGGGHDILMADQGRLEYPVLDSGYEWIYSPTSPTREREEGDNGWRFRPMVDQHHPTSPTGQQEVGVNLVMVAGTTSQWLTSIVPPSPLVSWRRETMSGAARL